jgi:hypothetical protein
MTTNEQAFAKHKALAEKLLAYRQGDIVLTTAEHDAIYDELNTLLKYAILALDTAIGLEVSGALAAVEAKQARAKKPKTV